MPGDPSDYKARLLDIVEDIIKHGYGEVNVEVSEVKNQFRTKIIIRAGRSWVFFKDNDSAKFDNSHFM